MMTREELESEMRLRLAQAFDRAGAFVDGLRPRVHNAVEDMREPVVSFVTTTVDNALELRERGENLAAVVSRDAKAISQQAGDWVKRVIRL